jgi:hypothetical protein
VEPGLDILLWDKSYERVKVLYRKYPTHSVRKAINFTDFILSLERKPRLIIIGKQNELEPKQIADVLAERLTKGACVLIWYVQADSQELASEMRTVGIHASCFHFKNEYLWISTYNILKNG